MKKLVIALSGAACLLATPALAQNNQLGVWGSVGYSHIDVEGMNLGGVTGRVGGVVTPHIGFEAEGTFGVGSESQDGVEVGLNYDWAAYLTGALPMTENARLIARLGYGTSELEAEEAGESESVEVNGFRYGVGAEFLFDDANGVRVDFTRVDAQDGLEGNLYTVSYVRRFR
jgi:outer membrane immunogenic protein